MVFVTYGTGTAIPFFDVCYSTFKKVYSRDLFIVYCLDEVMYQHCLRNGVDAIVHYTFEPAEYQKWSIDQNSGYQKIVQQKFKIVADVAKQYDDFVFIDMDTIHVSNVTDYLSSLTNGFYSSVYRNNSFCSGILYFKHVDQSIFNTLTSIDYDDEKLLTHFYYAAKMDIISMDKNIMANPRYGEVPDGCGILHYPGLNNTEIKLKLLTSAAQISLT